ncbi:MAG: hypothetical protein JW846_05310 [Dehalococcoidia bacterium]|nr:hypothetical protein [Dehalococcoidia bacterium]
MSDESYLSPIARERLARIGQLSEADQRRMKAKGELEHILSEYYLGNTTIEALWQNLKSLMESHGAEVVSDAQKSIVGTLRLQMNAEDFEKRQSAVLALETLKSSKKYSAIEMILGSVTALRKRYDEVWHQAYDQVRGQLEERMQESAEQARRQGILVDTEGAVDASIKSSPEWREFMSRHDASAQQTLHDYIVRITELL